MAERDEPSGTAGDEPASKSYDATAGRPVTAQATFKAGDHVEVKRNGYATVLSTECQEIRYKGRVQVQYPDGKTYWCRPQMLRLLQPSLSRVTACPTTREYRCAAMHNAWVDDVCLEVGCHEGLTTAMLTPRVKFVVGIDIARQPVLDARQRFPGCRFEVCDGFDIPKLRSLSPKEDGSFDKIFIDVGGIAPLPLVLSLVGTLFQEFRQARIVVKSVHMSRFLEASELFHDPADTRAQGRHPPPPPQHHAGARVGSEGGG